MKALILNGKVVDVNEKEFEVHSSMSWVDCDDKVKHGWTYDGKTFKTDEPTLTAEEKLNRVRAKRNSLLQASDWVVIKEREEGGTVTNFAAWKEEAPPRVPPSLEAAVGISQSELIHAMVFCYFFCLHCN